MVCAQDDEPAAAYNLKMLINTAYQRQLALYPQPFRLRKHIVQCGDLLPMAKTGHIVLRTDKTKLWATVIAAMWLQPPRFGSNITPVSADKIYWGITVRVPVRINFSFVYNVQTMIWCPNRFPLRGNHALFHQD